MSSSLRVAFLCGATPLLAGTLILLTWLVTGWGWWERAWLWTIMGALVFFVVGVLGVVRHLRQATRQGWLSPALALGLLLLNFPVGAFYMWVVVDRASRYTVEVQNESRQPIDSLVLTGAGIGQVELGPIPTGAGRQKHLRLVEDGKLQFSGRQGAQQHNGILENSAGPGSGGQRIIRVASDGSWEVLSANPRQR
jgi:hypothetical protein